MTDTIQRFFSGMKGKTVVFCGIARNHIPLIPLFLKYGAHVVACDRRSAEALGETAKDLAAQGVELRLGDDYLKDLSGDVIFRTPGMKYYTPELVAARKKGCAVTSETEVFFDLCPCRIYAVTGSDGKTTTTSLIAAMLEKAGKTVHLGGNIGHPLLQGIETISPDDAAVVELSSFQLISMRQSPDVGVITNITPNHLDMHASMEEYVNAKLNILLHQNAFSRAVLNLDNELTRSFADVSVGGTLFFSRRERSEHGFWLDGNWITKDDGQKVLDIREIRIPGWHNVENFLAAITAVWGDVSVENIREVAREFKGVEHRNELVRVLDGVSWYNDSIGTTPTRTVNGALSLFDRKIILIAGGYDKHIPYEPLGDKIPSTVSKLILMGATGPKIEEAVKKAADYREGEPEIYHAASMEEAVTLAHELAVPDDIVSLSPASASFDLYPEFEARGRHFKSLVNQL